MDLKIPYLYRSIENTMEKRIETHPLLPFFPEGTQLLMLGSFPPQREKWRMDFYYPNFQNDMWRIMGLVFGGNKDYFLSPDGNAFDKEKLIAFLKEKRIALYDTALRVHRQKDNASDKFLEVVEAIDPVKIFSALPDCRTVVTTGQKATDTLLSLLPVKAPEVGGYTEFQWEGRSMRFYRMPSSSRAYPLALEKKAEAYRNMFQETKILEK